MKFSKIGKTYKRVSRYAHKNLRDSRKTNKRVSRYAHKTTETVDSIDRSSDHDSNTMFAFEL